MRWNEMTVGKKIGTGFGVVLLLLVVSALLSFSGVGGIVKNATEVIDGNKLDGELGPAGGGSSELGQQGQCPDHGRLGD